MLTNWALNSRLTVNISKTKYMVIYGAHKIPNNIDEIVKITYNEKPLCRVDKYTYLGCIIDDKITFEFHVNQFISKAYNKIYAW